MAREVDVEHMSKEAVVPTYVDKTFQGFVTHLVNTKGFCYNLRVLHIHSEGNERSSVMYIFYKREVALVVSSRYATKMVRIPSGFVQLP